MMRNVILFIVALLAFSYNALAQNGNNSQPCAFEGGVFPSDTLFVQKTETYLTEKYELVFRNGESSKILYSLTAEDGSSIEYLMSYKTEMTNYDCFSVYNNAADGNSFLFFDKINRCLYVTNGCYMSYYYPVAELVDFIHLKALLNNRELPQNRTDTLKIGNCTAFVGDGTAKYLEVGLKYLGDVSD